MKLYQGQRPADDRALQNPCFQATPQILYDVAYRNAKLDLVEAGTRKQGIQRNDLVSPAPGEAQALKLLAAVLDNPGNIRQRFDVVNQSRQAEQAVLGGEWRARPHLRALALDGVQKRRFLTAHIAAAPDVDLDVEGKVAMQDALA